MLPFAHDDLHEFSIRCQALVVVAEVGGQGLDEQTRTREVAPNEAASMSFLTRHP